MKLRKYIQFAFLYIVIQAIGMAIMYYGLGAQYGSPEMTPIVFWSEVVLSLLVLYYIRRYASWREVGFGEFKWVRVLWIAPILLLSLVSLVNVFTMIASADPSSQEIIGVVIVGVMTLLVGFAEETMFRGILLRGAMARHNVFLAMLISAVGFSLLHSINIFGGEPATSVATQMFSTLLYGLFMAPMALLVGNLIPLIIAHFLWDFVLLAPGQVASITAAPVSYALAQSLIIPVQFVMMIAGWVAIYVLWRRGQFQNK